MTTICAVKKGKQLCIVSDTLALFGCKKEISGKHVHRDGKKNCPIGPNYIGTSGHHFWGLILDHNFSKKKTSLEWKTADSVFILHRCICRPKLMVQIKLQIKPGEYRLTI